MAQSWSPRDCGHIIPASGPFTPSPAALGLHQLRDPPGVSPAVQMIWPLPGLLDPRLWGGISPWVTLMPELRTPGFHDPQGLPALTFQKSKALLTASWGILQSAQHWSGGFHSEETRPPTVRGSCWRKQPS